MKPGSVSVLSLDGGGIKGLVLTKILDCLMKQSGLRITEMFSWITGTSTGGMLSLALAVGLTPLEAQCMYFKLKDKVFVGNRPYEVEPMEKFLKEVFKDQIMTDLPKKPHIAVTGTLADRSALSRIFALCVHDNVLGIRPTFTFSVTTPRRWIS